MQGCEFILTFVNEYIDLEKLSLEFAKDINNYCRSIKLSIFNKEYVHQIIRSSSSVGANYRESNNNLGKKDEIHRLRISRKEIKETIFWLHLLEEYGDNNESKKLLETAIKIMKILSVV